MLPLGVAVETPCSGVLRWAPNVLLMKQKYAKVFSIIHRSSVAIYGDRMAALCKLLSFASHVMAISTVLSLLVYTISHKTITGYRTKITSTFHVCIIHHKLSVVSSLSNACPQPEPALSHLRGIRANLYVARLLWILCTVILMNGMVGPI